MGIMQHALAADDQELLSRQAWKDFLGGYFDGQAHAFGTSSIVFPSGNIGFHAPESIGNPGSLDSAKVEILVGGVSSEARVSHRDNATVWDEMRRWEIIILNYSAKKSRRVADNAASCMRILLQGGRHVLAQSGLRIKEVHGPVDLTDPQAEYQVRRFIIVTRGTVSSVPAGFGQTGLSATATGV